MGLGISVYKNVKKVDENDLELYDNYFQVKLPHPDWADRMSNLEINSYYTGEEAIIKTPSSPHSYHLTFREYLLGLINRDWETIKSGDPFFEFIMFSDCEGCIDWQCSAKLYNDFENFYEKFKIQYEGPIRYTNILSYYEQWMESFKTASLNRGVVVYS